MSQAFQEYHKDNFVVSTDPARLDLDAIHAYLSRSYWAEGRSKEVVARSIQHSLCFGLYTGQKQIGLVRVVSDLTLFAYLCDVYVLEEYRGQGLSRWLLGCVMNYPDLASIRFWSLKTRDAHGLYRQFGFTEIAAPDRYMEKLIRPK